MPRIRRSGAANVGQGCRTLAASRSTLARSTVTSLVDPVFDETVRRVRVPVYDTTASIWPGHLLAVERGQGQERASHLPVVQLGPRLISALCSRLSAHELSLQVREGAPAHQSGDREAFLSPKYSGRSGLRDRRLRDAKAVLSRMCPIPVIIICCQIGGRAARQAHHHFLG